MWSVRRVLFIGMLICAVFTPVCGAKTAARTANKEHPSVAELLDRYAATQDKLPQSFKIATETTGKGATNHPMVSPALKGKTLYAVIHSELCCDGNRMSTRVHRWLNLLSPPDKRLGKNHKAYHYMRLWWDGKFTWEYAAAPRNDPGMLIIHTGADAKKVLTIAGSYESTMMGIFEGDEQRVDRLLRRAEGVSVRPQTQRVGDWECYVIDADTKHGKYTVWIDPAHGYNIARADIQKKEGDLADGKRMEAGVTASFSYRVVRFEQVEGVWLPMEAELQQELKWGGGYFDRTKSHFKRTSVTLNPDHDALGSFVLGDVPNGATVSIIGFDGRYRWQDGEVVDGRGFKVSLDPDEPGYLPVLVDKALPDLKGLGLELDPNETKGKMVLVCFWDINQRPSRHVVRELGKKAEELRGKGVAVVCVQASKVEKSQLDAWVKEFNIPFPVGMIEGDEEKTRFNWGVKSLPWLILADKEHIVRAEGFVLEELDRKTKEVQNVGR